MSKLSKPGQSKPLEQKPPETKSPELTPDERSKKIELILKAACEQLQCTPIFAQRTIDGQLHPIPSVPIVLCFVPNENIKQATPPTG
jgi:hypothetical protein